MHLYCQLSNLLGFFPVWYCIQHEDYELAAMIAVCFGFSMIYHIDEESEVGLFIDLCGVGILLGALFLTLKKSTENQSDLTVANLLTVLFILSSFASYLYATDIPTNSKEYSFYHSCWHILTVYGITTFLYSFFTDKKKSRFLCLRIVRKKRWHSIPSLGVSAQNSTASEAIIEIARAEKPLPICMNHR